jgi:succinate dehydrogenase/fumarate reductase cytochrome b subunit
MVIVRHYGAVLEAVFHSFAGIWLLRSVAEVEHTADNKQMLCQQ